MGKNSRRHLGLGPLIVLAWCAILCAPALWAQAGSDGTDYRSLARDIFKELVEVKSTDSGVGSTPAAEDVARRLRAAGFAEGDIQVIGPAPRKKNVVVRLHGAGEAKPILIIGHLDVVEARKEDWSPDLDPFQFVERDGYFYGRGTQDMKGSAAIALTNFIRWKQEGWVPARDLILALTADEELYGDENGVAWLVNNHRDLVDAEYSLNSDAGDFQSRGGEPFSIAVAAGEKKETILELETRNRGGHGSVPRKDNAIYELMAALARVEALKFPVVLNDVSRAEFAALAGLESGQVAADMKAVGLNPSDTAAIERLSEDPYYNALLRTTCVATMLDAGHGPSALPQRALATLNCRIAPGYTANDMLRALREAIADPGVEITWQFNEPHDPPASPLREDVFGAVTEVAHRMWPGVIVMPGMETGMADSRILRVVGIPSYGVSGLFVERGDGRAHGKDERIRASDFYAGVDFYDQFMKALVR